MKISELDKFITSLKANSITNAEFKDTINEYNLKNEILSNDLQMLRNNNKELKQDLDYYKKENDELSNKLSIIQNEKIERRKLRDELQSCKEELRVLIDTNEVLISDLNDKRIQLTNLETEYKILKDDYEIYREEFKKKPESFNVSFLSNNSTFDVSSSSCKNFLSCSFNGETVAEIKISSLEQELETVRSTYQSLMESKANVDNELNDKIQKLNNVEKTIQNLNSINAIQQQSINQLETNNDKLMVELKNKDSMIDELKKELELCTNNAKEIGQEVVNLKQEVISKSEMINELNDQLNAKNCDLLSTKNENELLIQDLNELSDSKFIAAEQLRKLTEIHSKCKTKNDEYEQQTEELKTEIISLKENLKQLNDVILQLEKEKVEKLQIKKELLISQKERDSCSTLIRSQDVTIENFKHDYELLQKENEKLSSSNNDLIKSVESIKKELILTRSQLKENEIEMDRISNSNKTLENQLLKLDKLSSDLKMKLDQLIDDNQALENKDKLLRKQFKELEETNRQVFNENQSISKDLVSFKNQCREFENINQQHVNEKHAISCQIDCLEKEKKISLDRINELKHEARHRDAMIEGLEKMFEQSEKNVEELSSEIENLKFKLAEADDRYEIDINKLKQNVQDLTKEIDESRPKMEEICELKTNIDRIKITNESLTKELHKAALEIKNLRQSLKIESSSFNCERRTKERLLNENKELEISLKMLKEQLHQLQQPTNETIKSEPVSNESINRPLSLVSLGHQQHPSNQFEIAEEEGQFMDPSTIEHSQLFENKTINPTSNDRFSISSNSSQNSQHRIEQLLHRNSLLLPHLRSTYPVEFQEIKDKIDENLIRGSITSLNRVSSKNLNLNLLRPPTSSFVPRTNSKVTAFDAKSIENVPKQSIGFKRTFQSNDSNETTQPPKVARYDLKF